MFGLLSLAVSVASAVSKCLTVANLAIGALKLIGNAFVSLGKALGIIKPDVKPTELGDKIIQAEQAGITPEKFSSYEEYSKKVESFKTDPEKSKLISEEAKLSKAVEYTAALSAEKFPSFPWDKFATNLIMNSSFSKFFNEGRMNLFGLLMKDNPSSALNIFNYLAGKELNDKKIDSAINELKNIEKKIKPDISDEEAMSNIRGARQ